MWITVNDPDDDDSATRAGFDSNSPLIDLGDGLFIHGDTRVQTRKWQHDVEIRVGVTDGRLAADEVRVSRHAGSPPVTSEALRNLPVASLVRYAADAVQYVVKEHDNGGATVGPAWPSVEEGKYVAAHGLDAETLRIVARVYRVAYLLGDSPTKKVETLFDLPRSTAGRWIAAARGRGFLSESRGPGKAGP